MIGALGRRDLLEDSDTIAGLMASLNKFTRHAAVLADHRSGNTQVLSTASLGPALVFGRLWEQTGLPAVLAEALEDRLSARGWELAWSDVLRDLEALRVTRLRSGAATCELRAMPQGVAGKVLSAAGVTLGPPLRFLTGAKDNAKV